MITARATGNVGSCAPARRRASCTQLRHLRLTQKIVQAHLRRAARRASEGAIRLLDQAAPVGGRGDILETRERAAANISG